MEGEFPLRRPSIRHHDLHDERNSLSLSLRFFHKFQPHLPILLPFLHWNEHEFLLSMTLFQRIIRFDIRFDDFYYRDYVGDIRTLCAKYFNHFYICIKDIEFGEFYLISI